MVLIYKHIARLREEFHTVIFLKNRLILVPWDILDAHFYQPIYLIDIFWIMIMQIIIASTWSLLFGLTILGGMPIILYSGDWRHTHHEFKIHLGTITNV